MYLHLQRFRQNTSFLHFPIHECKHSPIHTYVRIYKEANKQANEYGNVTLGNQLIGHWYCDLSGHVPAGIIRQSYGG